MICVDSRRAKAKLLDSYLISMEAQAGVAWLFSTSATYVTLSPESMSKGRTAWQLLRAVEAPSPGVVLWMVAVL